MGQRIDVEVQRQESGGSKAEERPAVWIGNEVQPGMLDDALGVGFFRREDGAIHLAPLDEPPIARSRVEEATLAGGAIVRHARRQDAAVHPAINLMDMTGRIAIRRWIPRHALLWIGEADALTSCVVAAATPVDPADGAVRRSRRFSTSRALSQRRPPQR